MRIEFIYPETCNLFGEIGNMEFLRHSFPDAEFIETAFGQFPIFLDQPVDFVFMAPMSENCQERILRQWKARKEDFKRRIEEGQHMFMLGNAQELFSEYIENDDGSHVEALGILPFHAERKMLKRINSIFKGQRGEDTILGFKSQFTRLYAHEDLDAFCTAEIGIGRSDGDTLEGFQYQNFLGTSLLGPLFLMNPGFSERYFAVISGDANYQIPFRDLAYKTYTKRLKDFNDPDVTI